MIAFGSLRIASASSWTNNRVKEICGTSETTNKSLIYVQVNVTFNKRKKVETKYNKKIRSCLVPINYEIMKQFRLYYIYGGPDMNSNKNNYRTTNNSYLDHYYSLVSWCKLTPSTMSDKL